MGFSFTENGNINWYRLSWETVYNSEPICWVVHSFVKYLLSFCCELAPVNSM